MKRKNRKPFLSKHAKNIIIIALISFVIWAIYWVGENVRLWYLDTQITKQELFNQTKKVEKLEDKKEVEELKKEVEDLKKKLETKNRVPGLFEKLALIKQYFPNDTLIAISTFMAESGLRHDAMNWNCYYNGKSQSCKKGDEAKAWSVDCGIAQINIHGQQCPKSLFNVEENLKVAKAKYLARGWQPWYSYTKGGYLGTIDKAKEYLAMVQ